MSVSNYAGALMEIDPEMFYRGVESAGRSVGRRIKEILNEEPSFPGTGGTKRLPKGDPPNKKQKLSQTKKMVKTTFGGSTVNALANRASMKRKGSENIKVNRKKEVKVSKTLRKKIGEVIKEKGIYGEYHKSFMGTIGVFQASTASPTFTIGDVANTKCWIAPDPNQNSSNNYTHWFNPINFGPDATAAGSYTNGKQFVFFTPLKFLDAASIIWNQKSMSLNSHNTKTGNITTRFNDADGAIFQDRSPTLKLDIKNSYVSFEIKNNSQRAVKISIKHLTPKIKGLSSDPLTSYLNSLDADRSYEGPVKFDTGDLNTVATNPLVSWNAVPSFASNWKYETVVIDIKPGETCSHTLKGPRNYTLDYSKLNVNGTDYTGAFWKGTVCAVMSVIPDMQVANTTVAGPPVAPGLNYNETGRFYDEQTSNYLKDPISVSVVEHYKLHMPEPTGFLRPTTAAGAVPSTPITLGFRKPKKVWGNYASVNPASTSRYSGYDEEMAATEIPGGPRH